MNAYAIRFVSLAICSLVAPLEADAQAPAPVPVVGVVSAGSPTAARSYNQAFEQRLVELGWIPGQTIHIEYRYAEGKQERPAELARELVQLCVDVIVARGTQLIQAAKQGHQKLEMAAQALGVRLQVLNVVRPEELDMAFAQAKKNRAEALIVLSSAMFYLHRAELVALAARQQVPTIYHRREFVVGSGGLISYGPDFHDLFRRAAGYVDKILKGAKPGDLPIEQPTKFELVINLRTAKALGLTIPEPLLQRADQVIR